MAISKLTLSGASYPTFLRKFLKNLSVQAIKILPSIYLCLRSDRAREFCLYFHSFDNFSPDTRPLTGQWISGKHLPWFLPSAWLVESDVYVSCCRFMHSRCRGVRTNVKNDSVSDIPGIGPRARFSTKYLLRSPRHYLYLMTRNYEWVRYKNARWKNKASMDVLIEFFQISINKY